MVPKSGHVSLQNFCLVRLLLERDKREEDEKCEILSLLWSGKVYKSDNVYISMSWSGIVYKSDNVYNSMLWSEKQRRRKNAVRRMLVRKIHVVPKDSVKMKKNVKNVLTKKKLNLFYTIGVRKNC